MARESVSVDDFRIRQKKCDEELCERIVDSMCVVDGPQRVLLIGESGIGKTRLAKLVVEQAIASGLFFITICLHLNNRFDDELSLYENIAFQIGVYDSDDKEEKKTREALLTHLKDKIIAKLKGLNTIFGEELAEERRKLFLEKRKIFDTSEIQPDYTTAKLKMQKLLAAEKRLAQKRMKHPFSTGVKYEDIVPYLLLILDDEGNMTSEDQIMKDFGLEEFLTDTVSVLGNKVALKVLITRRNAYENTTNCVGETKSDFEAQDDMVQSEGEIESPQNARSEEKTVTFQTGNQCSWRDMSQDLLDTITEPHLHDLFKTLIKDETRDLLISLQEGWKIDMPLTSLVVAKSSRLPAAVFMLAKSLNCITHHKTFNCLSPIQEKLLKEALSPCHIDEPLTYSVSGHNPILQLAYQLLETDDTLKDAIVDCFWHSLDFFKHCGCIHYGELITQWILEGYFDHVRSVKNAYNDAHAVLVELIKRGFLKLQEEGEMVVPESAMDNLIDLRHHGILGNSRLRFARVYRCDKKKGLGKVFQIDDMIETIRAKKQDRIHTILVSGNRLRREIPSKFFKQLAGLKVLVLFDPTLECLTEHLRDLRELQVLVIRNCDLLSNIEELRHLQRLIALEVSGSSSVEDISDDFFALMSKLQTLNLSGLWIKHSPSSISQLKDLHSLILRDCPVLEYLPDIQKLEKLEVVDIRGAHNLQSCFGEIFDTRRNQSFSRLRQLQLLDFSESKIKRLPMFHGAGKAEKLHFLKRLSLKNCSNLIKLPNLKPLVGLQILDLSGTTSLVHIGEACFKDKTELKVLNLSGTKLTNLPSTLDELYSLSQLLIRDNSNLEVIPDIQLLMSLEVFDVSGCTNLHTIEGSFEKMAYLREVNLCGTRIETVPELPKKSLICCSKLIVLADSGRWEQDTWVQVKEAIRNGVSTSRSSSDKVDGIQEISRKKYGRVGKNQLNEPLAFDCHNRYMDVFMNTIPFVDTKSHQEILEIYGSSGVDQDKESLAKAEFVSLVNSSAASLSSIFNDLKSVKGCWLEMCRDIKIFCSGVENDHLETLSITNFRCLDSVSISSFMNLKKLSLDCCPSIITVFSASVPPTSLQVLKIKFCEKLEKVFEEEVELPNLHTLWLFELPVLSSLGAKLPNLERYNEAKCPKLKSSLENLKRGNGSNESLFDSNSEKTVRKHGD